MLNQPIKRFLIKAIIFILPISFLIGFIEYKLRDCPNTYNVKRNYFEAQLDSINILVLGSSQAYFGINPAYFSSKGFNLSNISQSIYYDKQLTMKYINKMKNLKCVVITISYFSLGYQLQDTPERWRTNFYYRYWDINYPEKKWYDLENYSMIMLYKPYTAFVEFKNIMLHRNVPDPSMNAYGWSSIAPVKDNPNISDILGKERVAFHDTRIRHENRFDEVFETLDNLVKTLTNRKIRVIFVTTPVLSTYSKYTDSKINAVNKKAVLSLCQKYGCKYLDYFTDPRFTNDDFSDNDHLNCIGASKFSKILNKDI